MGSGLIEVANSDDDGIGDASYGDDAVLGSGFVEVVGEDYDAGGDDHGVHGAGDDDTNGYQWW